VEYRNEGTFDGRAPERTDGFREGVTERGGSDGGELKRPSLDASEREGLQVRTIAEHRSLTHSSMAAT
jgi:hypothetical protein